MSSPISPSVLAVSADDIQRAAVRIAGKAHRTPVLRSRTADQNTQAELYFKAENFQRMGAFKFRGATNAIMALRERVSGTIPGVIAYSSGNHAQAVAIAAREFGLPATIVMPSDAPPLKLAATRAYGAELIVYNRVTEDREAIAKKLATERGFYLIPPFGHPDIIAGQGTAAWELIEEVGKPLDVILAPVSGGGILAGSAIAAHALLPNCLVIGVEPEAGNDVQQSMRTGKRVEIPVPDTIADGARSTHVGEMDFAIMQQHVADIITVSDAQLIDAMRFFFTRMKIVVEPTGCLSAAAAFEKKIDLKGKRVGIILSGGNVDPQSFGKWMLQTG